MVAVQPFAGRWASLRTSERGAGPVPRAVGVLLVALLTGAFPGARDAGAQESIVVQAGAGIGDLWGTPEDLPKDSRVSARVDAALVFPFSSRGALQIGPSYARESGRESGSGVDYTLTVDFLELPVLARFGSSSTPVAPHVVLGPTVALSLSCEIRQVTSAPGGLPESAVTACRDAGEGALELGALAGIGLDVRLTERTALTLELMHARVLTPVDARRLKSWSLVAGILWDRR